MVKSKILAPLLVACFLLTASWLVAAEDATPADETAATEAVGPEPVASRGELAWLAASDPGDCTVSLECADGTIIQCSGSNSSCTTGPDYVECDGQRTYCPTQSCTAHITCSRIDCDIFCRSDTGDCEEGFDWVRCDGETTYCHEQDPNFCI